MKAYASLKCAKFNLGARFNEAAAYRDLAERKEKGEVIPSGETLPDIEPLEYMSNYPTLFAPEQFREAGRAMEHGKTAEAWGIVSDNLARLRKESEHRAARLDQDAKNRTDRHDLPKSDSKLADALETGAEITGTLALWIILSKAKGAQMALSAIGTAGDFLETFNKEIKADGDPVNAFLRAGGETAYGVTKDMIISTGVNRLLGEKTMAADIVSGALSVGFDAVKNYGDNKRENQ